MEFTTTSKRPRNVDASKAGALLYGDWGTSKIYVIGIAFALSGYHSFWLILMMSVLSVLVACNYMIICKLYPNGGGVYASVRNRSQVIALVGAYFITADFIVTASLSSLSAFSYLGVHNPLMWATGAILAIGLLNFFGPKNTGALAFPIAGAAGLVVLLLAICSIPFLKEASYSIEPLTGGIWKNWREFTNVVLALSGIEAIANATGVMKLNPGSTSTNPKVTKTSTPAILTVMLEVAIFTTLLGFAVNALQLQLVDGNINAPGEPGVRDFLLRYMGQHFVSILIHPVVGQIFAIVIGVVFCALLLSAVNTAIVALIGLFFVMSRDGELPGTFQRMNRFGVPIIPWLFAMIVPAVILLIMKDLSALADLYAVGFVGAIATNLGATSTDPRMPLSWPKRVFMFISFMIMLGIEITLFIDKPNGRLFAMTMILGGLLLRGLAKERADKKLKLFTAGEKITAGEAIEASSEPILCAAFHISPAVDRAIEKAKKEKRPLYLLSVREQNIVTDDDRGRTWEEDARAIKIFEYAKSKMPTELLHPCYVITESASNAIAQFAKELHVKEVLLALPKRSAFYLLLRGNLADAISEILPPEIILSVVRS